MGSRFPDADNFWNCSSSADVAQIRQALIRESESRARMNDAIAAYYLAAASGECEGPGPGWIPADS